MTHTWRGQLRINKTLLTKTEHDWLLLQISWDLCRRSCIDEKERWNWDSFYLEISLEVNLLSSFWSFRTQNSPCKNSTQQYPHRLTLLARSCTSQVWVKSQGLQKGSLLVWYFDPSGYSVQKCLFKREPVCMETLDSTTQPTWRPH